MKDEEKEEVKIYTSLVAIIIFILLVCSIMSCSAYSTAIEIPHHIQERIQNTEDTYILDVKYLVWNDFTQSYVWEYYSDYHHGL